MYTEDQLSLMLHEQLKQLCQNIADRCKVPLERIVPKGARREILIEAILEDQEEKGGSGE